MSDGRKYYCLCESNCKFETMTKEQILAAIAQAIETGSVGDVDTGFVTKLKDMNYGTALTVWIGTRAQYNAVTEKAKNCLYIITDDTTSEDMLKACQQALADVEEIRQHVAEEVDAASKMCETAKAESEWAVDAATAAQAIDVSSSVALAFNSTASSTTADTCYISEQKYSYVPSLGIVFFNFTLSFNRFTAGDTIAYNQSGNYKRDISAFRFAPMQSADKRLFAKLTPAGFLVNVLENVAGSDVTGTASVEFSGWYFSNGEE